MSNPSSGYDHVFNITCLRGRRKHTSPENLSSVRGRRPLKGEALARQGERVVGAPINNRGRFQRINNRTVLYPLTVVYDTFGLRCVRKQPFGSIRRRRPFTGGANRSGSTAAAHSPLQPGYDAPCLSSGPYSNFSTSCSARMLSISGWFSSPVRSKPRQKSMSFCDR